MSHPRKPPDHSPWVLLLLPAFFLVHQSSWFWADDRLILGLPVDLLYHLILCLLVPIVMFLVVRYAWPSFPEE